MMIASIVAQNYKDRPGGRTPLPPVQQVPAPAPVVGPPVQGLVSSIIAKIQAATVAANDAAAPEANNPQNILDEALER